MYMHMHMLCTATCLFGRGVLRPGDWDGRAADDGERDGEGPEGEDEAPVCVWLYIMSTVSVCCAVYTIDGAWQSTHPNRIQQKKHGPAGRECDLVRRGEPELEVLAAVEREVEVGLSEREIRDDGAAVLQRELEEACGCLTFDVGGRGSVCVYMSAQTYYTHNAHASWEIGRKRWAHAPFRGVTTTTSRPRSVRICSFSPPT